MNATPARRVHPLRRWGVARGCDDFPRARL